VRKVIDGLLDDIAVQLGLSTVGDKSFLRTLSDSCLLGFLDDFSSHLLHSVEVGYWSDFQPAVPLGERQYSAARHFLLGVRKRVFDADGKLSTYPCPHAFHCLYQMGAILDKFGSGTVTETMRENALTQYLLDETVAGEVVIPDEFNEVLDLAKKLVSDRILRFIDWQPPKGRHGPGAVAEGSIPFWEKYRFTPYEEMDLYYPGLRLENSLKSNFSTSGDRDPRASRLLFVPKKWNKCRVICAEPALLQYMQQGWSRRIGAAIDLSDSQLDLHDQTRNAIVAKQSSDHGYYGTIDLKSASDRLSLTLTRRILPWVLSSRVENCRSQRTVLPDKSTLELSKFGSMGNALTFPVQTLVFWSLMVALRCTRGESVSNACQDTWVYGDDIIIPSSVVPDAFRLLSSVGLAVNEKKSFYRGPFRESCGVHAFAGRDVTPAYLRSWSSDALCLVSQCATARRLSQNGFTTAAEVIYEMIERALSAKLPYSRRTEGLVRWAGEEMADSDLIRLNRTRGRRLHTDRYQRLVVEAFWLKEIKHKRKYVSFDNSEDLWDYIGPYQSLVDRDRGIVAGQPKLLSTRLLFL